MLLNDLHNTYDSNAKLDCDKQINMFLQKQKKIFVGLAPTFASFLGLFTVVLKRYKSTLVVNFIKVLRTSFSYEILAQKITKLKQNCKAEHFSFVIFGTKISAKKRA